MDYAIITFLIVVVFTGVSMLIVPFLKQKGLWAITLIAVNLIEGICDFLSLQKYGDKKFAWVDALLKQVSPKLTQEEREKLIEQIVSSMNALKG